MAQPDYNPTPPNMTTEEFLIEQDRVRDASDADEVARLLSGYQEALRDDPKSRWLPYLCGHASGELDYRLAEEADRKRKGSAT